MRSLRLCGLSVCVLALMGIGFSGCGSSGGSKTDSSTVSATNADSSAGSGVSSDVQARIDTATKGYYHLPPATPPAPAKKGANVWYITVAADAYPINEPGTIVAAAKALDWKLTVFDGNYSAATETSGIRQAIADKASGIILFDIDCADVQAALESAKSAHIPVVGEESADCDQYGRNGPSLFGAEASYSYSPSPTAVLSYPDWIKDLGNNQALATIAATSSKAKVILIKETDLASTLIVANATADTLRQDCSTCSIVDTIDITGADVGAPVQEKVAQALAQYPQANAVISPYDAVSIYAAAAVRASGRASGIWMEAAEGSPQMVNLIRTGAVRGGGVGEDVKWEMWSAADALNRLLDGQKPANGFGFPSGNSLQIWDKATNLPPEGQRYSAPLDYQAAYKKAWGVG
jgi:ribose transport system substrate-binding protein